MFKKLVACSLARRICKTHINASPINNAPKAYGELSIFVLPPQQQNVINLILQNKFFPWRVVGEKYNNNVTFLTFYI